LRIEGGEPVATIIEAAKAEILGAGFRSIDYVACADADTLVPVATFDPARPARVFAAAHLGRARLIDNLPVG